MAANIFLIRTRTIRFCKQVFYYAVISLFQAFGISFIVAGTLVDKSNLKTITDMVFPDSPVVDILFTLLLQAGAVITIFAFTGWYGAVSGTRILLSLVSTKTERTLRF